MGKAMLCRQRRFQVSVFSSASARRSTQTVWKKLWSFNGHCEEAQRADAAIRCNASSRENRGIS
jgi:hypothetical protein